VPSTDVAVIGGGLAGLACALQLVEQGFNPLVLEAAERPGGRVRTDEYKGFLMDRGFQVLQTAYPAARRILDYDALDLRPFQPGALIRFAGRFYRIGDPWRRLVDLLPTLFAPIGTLADKLRIARLRRRVLQGTEEELYARPETTTIQALHEFGFSEAIIERFLRPFLAAVFFDDRLEISSRAFEFVFRAFSGGDTALPAGGMEAILRQLVSRLPPEALWLNTRVGRIDGQAVVLDSGERIRARAVVVATDGGEAARLLGDNTQPQARPTTCLYFAAPRPPVGEPLLVLNGEGQGPINSLLVPSNLSQAYAPPGQALVTVNLLGNPRQDDSTVETSVRGQLGEWFGPVVREWQLLRIYRITRALPLQGPPVPYPLARSPQKSASLFFCGEYRSAPSIQWALASGEQAGAVVAAALRS
jgi:phytoene dehydrogenase-like protein